MIRFSPSPVSRKPETTARGHKAGSATVLVMMLAGLILLATAGDQVWSRQRVPPPEPSRKAWVSFEAETQMVRALELYRRFAAQPQPPPLPGKTTLRAGDMGQPVADLRARLALTGDLSERGRGDSYSFDQDVEDAVKRFQARNGVEPTGIVYGITQRLLNVPLQTRVRQLELNLQRMRDLLPKIASEPKYILMNAASFELQGIRNGVV
jgi:murein L,D-transpeptidase YcbB/YkuD